MGQKYQVHRDVIIERVHELCGVDVQVLNSDNDIVKAIAALVHIKVHGLETPTT